MGLPAPGAAFLAAIVESSDDAIISKDLNGVITSWNGAAAQMFGYTAAEAVGRPITILIPPDRLGEEDMVLGRIRRGEDVSHFETVRWRRDGTLLDVSLTISPIRDTSGTIVGASKIARDITARKQMDARLEELQNRLLGLATASGSILGSPRVQDVVSATIGVARGVISADGYAVWRCENPPAWRVVESHGLSEAFAARVFTPDADRPHPANSVRFSEPLIVDDVADAPTLAQARGAYAAEGIRSMAVFPLVIRGTASGTLAFYFRRQREFHDMDVQVGRALANIAAAALTTAELYEEQRERREAADRARQQATVLAEAGSLLSASLDYEKTLAAVADLAVPAIADWCAVDIIDERGVLRRLAVADVDRRPSPSEAGGDSPDPTDPRTPGAVQELIRSGRAVLAQRADTAAAPAAAPNAGHDGGPGLRSYMCVPMLAHGQAFGAITFVSADSGRVFSDADLRLAGEIAARASMAVQNARSYARANEASRLKDEFLATLSHELRTPLNAVLGYARMLRMGAVSPGKTKPALEVVERNATALKQIIEDVLDVSRIVSGRLRLNVAPVDLPAILREACAAVEPGADAKGVRIEMVIDPHTPPVSGDGDRLQQVVWNLLANAIKFTPRGGKVQVRLARVNSHVEITVSDTGRGIGADFLPFVFDRFRQADATFAREHGGLGLGLAIAKDLVELHGGTVHAASDGAGTGATFVVRLPLMIVHADADPGSAAHPRADWQLPSLASPPRLDGIEVLAVDDEPDSLNLLTAVLEGAGAKVATSSSAAAALDALTRRVPHVIIADIGMPGMDGLELIRAIRQSGEPLRSMPAAALTAYARSQDRILSLASGFQMHLVKPIDPLELIVAVSALASRRAGT